MGTQLDPLDRIEQAHSRKILTQAVIAILLLPVRHAAAIATGMAHDLRIALYQPDIPGNTGTIIRTAACFGLGVDVIEPAGFDLSDRALKRSGMDYVEQAALTRHLNWQLFDDGRRAAGRRLILATTKASQPYTSLSFRPGDTLLFGRESAGVPEDIHQAADVRIVIPLLEGRRSLNLAVSVGIVTAEAMRQLDMMA